MAPDNLPVVSLPTARARAATSAAAAGLSAAFEIHARNTVGTVGQLANDIESIADEWDDLADRAGASPFMRPGWIAAWWRAFGTGDLEIVTARRNGHLTGVLPLERDGRTLRALANHHSPSFGPIAENRAAARALAERTFAEMPARLELFMLEEQDNVGGELVRTAKETRHPVHARVVRQTPYLSVDSQPHAVLEGLSRRDRKEVRRRRRRLEELGPVELETVRDASELEKSFEDLLTLEGSGWKVERGTAIASQPKTRDFYREVATWAARRGFLTLFFLTVAGRRIAVDLCMEHKGVRYMLKGGFDPDYANVSPGNLLLAENLSHATGLHRIELGGGSDAYKLRWTNATVPFSQIQIFARSPTGRGSWVVHAHALPAARRLRDRWSESRGRPGQPR
jgi:CelD/BcsL family acetyltransferase involved in cellulose biosynthesis